jgi:hypothetical protein
MVVGHSPGIERDVEMSRLDELLEETRKLIPSDEEKEEQRRSFAYGNTKIENTRITRETVDKEAEKLTTSDKHV